VKAEAPPCACLPMREEEQYAGLPLHYLFGAIPIGSND
jgi:hypothetical protein